MSGQSGSALKVQSPARYESRVGELQQRVHINGEIVRPPRTYVFDLGEIGMVIP